MTRDELIEIIKEEDDCRDWAGNLADKILEAMKETRPIPEWEQQIEKWFAVKYLVPKGLDVFPIEKLEVMCQGEPVRNLVKELFVKEFKNFTDEIITKWQDLNDETAVEEIVTQALKKRGINDRT